MLICGNSKFLLPLSTMFVYPKVVFEGKRFCNIFSVQSQDSCFLWVKSVSVGCLDLVMLHSTHLLNTTVQSIFFIFFCVQGLAYFQKSSGSLQALEDLHSRLTVPDVMQPDATQTVSLVFLKSLGTC